MSEEPPVDPRVDDDLALLVQREPESPAGRRALDDLLRRWNERVYRWAYRFMGEREQALDLAQDCLVQMMRALPRYQAHGRFSAWLFTIVHHRCLDELRRRRAQREPEAGMDTFASEDDGPEARVDLALEHERVREAIRSALEPNEQLALWLRAGEEQSIEHITRLLELENASGARGLLQTARRKLRAALAVNGGDREEA